MKNSQSIVGFIQKRNMKCSKANI